MVPDLDLLGSVGILITCSMITGSSDISGMPRRPAVLRHKKLRKMVAK
jgi:hypothetical protein